MYTKAIASQKVVSLVLLNCSQNGICSQLYFRRNPHLNNNSFDVVVDENFLKLMSGIKPQIQEDQAIPGRMNAKKKTQKKKNQQTL